MTKDESVTAGDGQGTASAESKADEVRKGSGSVLGNVLALSGGSVVAQGLAILAAPIMSRLFAPSAFGVAEVYAAIVGVIASIGCLRYELAIVLPKRDDDAASVLGLCVVLAAAVTLILVLGAAFGGQAILLAVKATALIPYRWIIPFSVFVGCMTLLLTYWNQRHKQFRRLASVRIAGSVIAVAVTLTIGFLGWRSATGLVIARLSGAVIAPAILLLLLCRYEGGFLRRNVTISGMVRMAKRYKKFPLFSSWTTFVGNATLQAPTLLLAGFFGPVVAGLYALSKRTLSLPVRVLGLSVGQVFYQRVAAAKASGEDMSGIVANVCCKLITIGLLPLLIIALTAPDVFGLIFGQRWSQAGIYASILTPCLFIEFVFSPLAVLFFVLERQGLDLWTRIITAALVIGSLLVGGTVIRNATLTIAILSFVASIGMLWRLSFLLKAVNARSLSILGHLLRSLISVAPVVAAYGACRWLLNLPLVYCLLAIAIGAIPYVALALRSDEQLRAAFFKVVRKVYRW